MLIMELLENLRVALVCIYAAFVCNFQKLNSGVISRRKKSYNFACIFYRI